MLKDFIKNVIDNNFIIQTLMKGHNYEKAIIITVFCFLVFPLLILLTK